MRETQRRRDIQLKYNEVHGITPETIIKGVSDIAEFLSLGSPNVPASQRSRRQVPEGLGRKELEKLSIELELAILDGKSAEAKAIVGKIHDAEETGHDVFKSDEREGGEAGEAPQNPGRGGRTRGGERPAANP